MSYTHNICTYVYFYYIHVYACIQYKHVWLMCIHTYAHLCRYACIRNGEHIYMYSTSCTYMKKCRNIAMLQYTEMSRNAIEKFLSSTCAYMYVPPSPFSLSTQFPAHLASFSFHLTLGCPISLSLFPSLPPSPSQFPTHLVCLSLHLTPECPIPSSYVSPNNHHLRCSRSLQPVGQRLLIHR